MKKTIRLKESDLKRIIDESVRRVLRETRFDKEDNYPRLPCEKSRPGDIPPGDEDIYYPGDINPDVLNALSRGDYGYDEDTLSNTINECVRKTISEKVCRQRIAKNVTEKIICKLYEGQEDSDMKRNAVMKALKDPKYNHAQLAYTLWPNMDKDTARSLFAKMANGTPDNDGVVRHFNDEDVNSLYQMIRKR